jgi:hypothetical protein
MVVFKVVQALLVQLASVQLVQLVFKVHKAQRVLQDQLALLA